MKKKFTLIIGWLYLVATVTGCLNSNTNDKPIISTNAKVSFTHASPDCPDLMVSIDEASISTSAISYKDYTGYLDVSSGVRNMKFKSAVDGALLVNATNTFADNKIYSAFVITSGLTFEMWIVDDTGTLTNIDNCMVRVVHASPDAPPVKFVLLGESATLPSHSFKQVSDFKELTAKTYTIEIRAESDNHLILSSPFNPQAGAFYTVALFGFTTPPLNNTHGLEIMITKN